MSTRLPSKFTKAWWERTRSSAYGKIKRRKRKRKRKKKAKRKKRKKMIKVGTVLRGRTRGKYYLAHRKGHDNGRAAYVSSRGMAYTGPYFYYNKKRIRGKFSISYTAPFGSVRDWPWDSRAGRIHTAAAWRVIRRREAEAAGSPNSRLNFGKRRRRGIKINPKMKGVFTRKAKARGMSVQRYATAVIKRLKGKTGGNKTKLKLLRQAVFARNAGRWARKRKSRFGTPEEDSAINIQRVFRGHQERRRREIDAIRQQMEERLNIIVTPREALHMYRLVRRHRFFRRQYEEAAEEPLPNNQLGVPDHNLFIRMSYDHLRNFQNRILNFENALMRRDFLNTIQHIGPPSHRQQFDREPYRAQAGRCFVPRRGRGYLPPSIPGIIAEYLPPMCQPRKYCTRIRTEPWGPYGDVIGLPNHEQENMAKLVLYLTADELQQRNEAEQRPSSRIRLARRTMGEGGSAGEYQVLAPRRRCESCRSSDLENYYDEEEEEEEEEEDDEGRG